MSGNPNTTKVDLTSPRTCNRCKGTGKYVCMDGTEFKCSSCNGTGKYPGLDVDGIINALFTSRGGTKRFRKAFPTKLNHYGSVDGARIYYVWRLARFHGGADVTLPMTADMLLGGDPFRNELDAMAEYVAEKVFGTTMAAAYRWGNLLGFNKGETPAGLPASAYEGGPVADDDKPEWEAAEIR